MTALKTPQIRTLAASIFHFFIRQDSPQADELYIPLDSLVPDEDADGFFKAKLRFTVNYCGRRSHSVHIKYQVDKNGRFVANSWNYA